MDLPPNWSCVQGGDREGGREAGGEKGEIATGKGGGSRGLHFSTEKKKTWTLGGSNPPVERRTSCRCKKGIGGKVPGPPWGGTVESAALFIKRGDSAQGGFAMKVELLKVALWGGG